jgi:sec-independent protein translocase protein TatB
MIDIAWSEFLFIALIALILIGPKELPTVLRNVGRWIGKARAFAKDLSTQLDLHAHMEEDKDDQVIDQKIVQNNEPPMDKAKDTKSKPHKSKIP